MSIALTAKFEKALQFAVECHHGQYRKGSSAPYISHPMAVASLVMEYGGDEDQVSAALLHDVIEDCGISEAEIEARFGAVVARIVADCSDWDGPAGAPKTPWRERKERYLKHLEKTSLTSGLVSAADKLHNARAIVHDVKHFGDKSWKKFKASPDEILWYYESMLKVFKKWTRKNERFAALVRELDRSVAEMKKIRPRKKK